MSRFIQRIPRSRGIVLSYLWVIIAVTLLTTLAAGATIAGKPRLYLGSAQVVVYSDSAKGAAVAAPDMGTEREVANSGVVATAAAKAMGVDITTATSGLSVSVPVDANVLVFKYSGATSAKALTGAVAFTEAYVDYRNKGHSEKLAEVISPATVPNVPQQANLPLVIGLGLILGAMLGIGFAFVWDRVRGRLRGSGDVSRQTGLSVLAEIPTVRQQFPLEPATALPSPSREVFGYLAAHLTTLTTRGMGASVLVTSPSTGAGKTTVAAQLAIAMAATGKEVVLVGGDLRHPDLHTLFGLAPTPGLTDVLADSTKLERSVQATDFVDLEVLPSGTSRIGSWFNMEDLELLMSTLSKRAFVVIDAPTAVGSAEAALLAGRTDFVLLVVDAQRGTRSAAAAAVAVLAGVGGNLIGCVTNAPRPRWFDRIRRRAVPRIEPRPGNEETPVDTGPRTESEHVGS
jgi:Mrp family chromosome partitioning ATPase